MKNKVGEIFLLLLSVMTTLFLMELGIRLYKSEFRFHNFLEIKLNLFRSVYPAAFDDELGWIPEKTGHQKGISNSQVTILDHGVRSNGRKEDAANKNIILAIGDSFTYGTQVSDDETWPSRLGVISNARVINGGVFGYGIDQSYLRMKELASEYRPNAIIFSFIPDDIYRCELSTRSLAAKPYFDISEDNELTLIKEHINPPSSSEGQLDVFRKTMGYSRLIHSLMYRLFPEYWLQGLRSKTRVHSRGTGTDIACRIFDKIKLFAVEKKIKIYILVQYDRLALEEDLGFVDKVVSCVDQDVLNLVDLRASLLELKKKDAVRFRSLFNRHMTPEGNDFVSLVLWEAMSR